MNIFDYILLSLTGIDYRTAVHLVRCFGSPESVLRATRSELIEQGELSEATADKLILGIDRGRAEREMAFVGRYGIRVLCYGTDGYPDSLLNCEDAPLLVYAKGDDAFDFGNDKMIAVVGTRKMSDAGMANCEMIVAQIAESHPDAVIVSGLAHGIDGVAHRAALRNGLKTVGVVAHGLDRIYPSAHRGLAEDIVRKGGMIVSEYPSGTDAYPYRFLERNRIVAGMTVATIMVESPRRGGSLVTADIADSYGRDVFTFPARLSDKCGEGNIRLLKNNRAHLLTGVDDIEYILNWPRRKNEAEGTLFALSLTDDERRVYELFDRYDRISVEHITELCGFDISKANALLTDLELNGILKVVMGRMYIKIK